MQVPDDWFYAADGFVVVFLFWAGGAGSLDHEDYYGEADAPDDWGYAEYF